MAVFILTAYKGFIQFNLTVQLFFKSDIESLTDALAHVPCRLLRHLNIICQFDRSNAFVAGGYFIDCHQTISAMVLWSLQILSLSVY